MNMLMKHFQIALFQLPKGAFKAEYGYQFRLSRFVAPSKYYKQAVGTSQESV